MRLPKDEEYLDFIALLGPVCAYLLLVLELEIQEPLF
jgi:hypothetical protein